MTISKDWQHTKVKMFVVHEGSGTIIDLNECLILVVAENNKIALSAIACDAIETSKFLADDILTPDIIKSKTGWGE